MGPVVTHFMKKLMLNLFMADTEIIQIKMKNKCFPLNSHAELCVSSGRTARDAPGQGRIYHKGNLGWCLGRHLLWGRHAFTSIYVEFYVFKVPNKWFVLFVTIMILLQIMIHDRVFNKKIIMCVCNNIIITLHLNSRR